MSKTPRKRAKTPARTRKSTPKTATTIAPPTSTPPTYPPPLYVEARTAAQIARELDQEHFAQYLADEISHGVKSKEVTVKWPADWVNALKERFAPAWLLSRHPVRYNSVSYTEMEWKTRGEITKYNTRTSFTPKSSLALSDQALPRFADGQSVVLQ